MSPFEAEKNAEAANHIVGIDAEVHELDWCSFDHADLVRLLQNVDCIVGADIFFEPALFKGRVFYFLYNFNLRFFSFERSSSLSYETVFKIQYRSSLFDMHLL